MKKTALYVMIFFGICACSSTADAANKPKPGNFCLSANAVDLANKGTLNLEASAGISRHWTLNAGARYNPFSYGAAEQEHFSKQRHFYAGVRWWPWHRFAGWWMSGTAGYQEFSNCPKGGTQTSEGDRYGAGIGAGYSKMLGTHFNLNFGVGMWMGQEKKTTYNCQHCGKITKKGEGFFLLPSDILLSVSYLF